MNSTTQAIDVHAHYGICQRADASVLFNDWVSADAATVVDRASQADIRLTIVSPLSGLLPRGQADAVSANREAGEIVRNTPGLRQWVIVHPYQPETFVQAAELLRTPLVCGYKNPSGRTSI
ncbi:MAG: hypothetical protein MK110_03040 [Fuerstiella sp.]|nr:hypothetical protein [Fuerstiella sp.]